MSYHRKVIYISLAVLLGVTVLSYLGELLNGGKVDGLEIGLVALAFSIFEGIGLLLTAAAIALFGQDDKTGTRAAPRDVLDSKENYQRKLTKGQRAGAFCAAAGLVLLLGGSLCFGSLSLGTGFSVR